MRRVILSIVAVLFVVAGAHAATPPEMKGLWLITDYPAVAARPGEAATFKLKLQNANLPPEQVALSVSGLPQGWKAEFRGGGQPIGAAMAATNESVSIELRLEAPAGGEENAKSLEFTVRAQGATQKAELPLRLMLSGDIAPKLGLKTKLPSLKGTPKSSFEYNFTLSNDSGRNLLVSLGADVPSAFQATFTEGYGSQEITSIPIEAGQTKDMKVKIQPPANVQAGKFDFTVRANAEGASAEAPLSMEVTGQPKLRLSAEDGRLSGSAEAGDTAQFTLIAANDGTAPLEELELSSSPPTDWKIEFEPKTIARIDAGQSREIQAMVTPSPKAIAGDYMTTFRANAKGGESTSVDYRVSVKTSTMWGAVGLGVIAVALLVLLGAVARFGRR